MEHVRLLLAHPDIDVNAQVNYLFLLQCQRGYLHKPTESKFILNMLEQVVTSSSQRVRHPPFGEFLLFVKY